MESGVWQRYIHHWDHCTEYSKPKYKSLVACCEFQYTLIPFINNSKQAFRSFWKLQSSLHKATYLHLPVSYYEARKLINPYVVKRKGFHVCVNSMTIISGQWKVSVCKFTNMSQTNGKLNLIIYQMDKYVLKIMAIKISSFWIVILCQAFDDH